MEEFKVFITKYTVLPEAEWEAIKQSFVRREFAKKEFILEEGKICRNFYFLERGLLRFFYNIDGDEIVKTFTIPPFCFTSKVSFRNQRPASESIQALETSVVWQTSYTRYQELTKLTSWKAFMNGLMNEVDEFSEQMIIQSKTLNPEQRYAWLTMNYPASLLQMIPQKYLASFLGIAPQSLCRIKNNKHQGRS